ncbi:hypothetical protein LINPERPRIM_LOCUS19141 [Linum perenne]
MMSCCFPRDIFRMRIPASSWRFMTVRRSVVASNALSHNPRSANAELSAVLILVASSAGHFPFACEHIMQDTITSSSLLTASLKLWAQVSKLDFTSGGGAVEAC